MSFLLHLISVPLAFMYSHIVEWVAHKYILHGVGKKRNNFWSFHWSAHHKKARKNDFYDSDYLNDWTGPPLKEKIGLTLLVLVHSPLIIYAPLFFFTLVVCAVRYYKIHKTAHLFPSWGKKYIPWHYDHHMGKNQDANWGVTEEWVDKLLKTRIHYESHKE